MGLKSIEMQVALPRTQELGRMQEQFNQRAVIDQHLKSEEEKKRAEEERKKTKEAQQKEKGLIASDEESRSSQQGETKKSKKKTLESKQKQATHPFVGNNIDIRL
jgi:hypothetical protein